MTTENFARPILSLMSTGKGYPLSTNEFIRDWLAREWFARGRTAADLARELKLTEATVSTGSAARATRWSPDTLD